MLVVDDGLVRAQHVEAEAGRGAVRVVEDAGEQLRSLAWSRPSILNLPVARATTGELRMSSERVCQAAPGWAGPRGSDRRQCQTRAKAKEIA